jgi:ArsR family transcriptional regulator, arsenate/arsenite/antimonite-responsive transcriptional repressor
MGMSISTSFDLFAALGDPVRGRLIRELAGGSRCTCDLTGPLGLSQPTVSYHIRILKEAGILEALPVGRFTHYRLRPEALAGAIEELVRLSASAARNEFDNARVLAKTRA